MTEVNIDIVNQGYESHPDDRVVIYSPANRNHAGQIISTAVTEIPLVNGKASKDLAPGPVAVRLECLGIADTSEKTGYVPESGPVSLWDVITDWTPALVDQGIIAILASAENALTQVSDAVATETVSIRADMVPRQIVVDSLIGDGGQFRNRTPWVASGGTLAHVNSATIVTGDGTSATISTQRAAGFIPEIQGGHTLYVRVNVRSRSVTCQALRVRLASPAGEVVVTRIDAPPHMGWQVVNGIAVVPASWGTVPVNIYIEGLWETAAAATGQEIEANGLTWIDITQAYGAGNEPSIKYVTRQKMKTPADPIIGPTVWDSNFARASRAELVDIEENLSAQVAQVTAGIAPKVAELSYPSTVAATNLLGNGFISQPAWAATTGAALTLSGGSGVATASSTTSPLGMRRTTPITVQAGDVLWVSARMRARNFQASAYKIRISDGTTEVSSDITSPAHLSWVTLSGTITVPQSLATKPLTVSVVAESTAIVSGSIVEVYRINMLNLTTMYGRGQEPPSAEILAIVSTLPNESVDGTVQNFHRDPVVVTKKALPDLIAGTLPDITDGMVETALVGKLPAREDWSPSKPGVILRFDDGYSNNLELAAPVLKKHGFRGYLAMCTRWQGQRPGGVVMEPAQVQQLASEYGWEIGSHTSEHMDAVGHPSFIRGLDESLADLASWAGVGYPNTFTYPNGSRTRQTDREVYLRFAKCQLTSSPETAPTPHDQPTFFTGWAVASGTATEATKDLQVERMKTYVRESMRRGHVAVLGFHGIELTAPTAVAYNLDLPTFTHIIEWLASEGIPVILPRDMPPHNLVADGGFNEFQVHPWGTGAAHPWGVSPYALADRWQRVTTGQYSGLAAMKITGTTAKNSSFSQGIAVRPGETYRIHALAKAMPTSGTVTIEAIPRDLTGDVVGTTHVIATVAAGTWADHTGEITIPAGATTVHVIARATDFIGEAWVDHLALFPTWLYDPLAI